MSDVPASSFVPKIHPLERDYSPEDPLELMGEALPGDPKVMLECMLQEFAWMGYDADQLWALFQNPGYPVLNQLREQLGDATVRQGIASLISAWGVLRFRESIEVSDEVHEPDVFQIELNSSNAQRSFGAKGSS